MLESKWFPDISELNNLMRPKLSERQNQIERLARMLKPAIGHDDSPLSDEQRMRMAGRLRRLGEHLGSGENLTDPEVRKRVYG